MLVSAQAAFLEGAWGKPFFGQQRMVQTVKKVADKLAGCNEGRPALHFFYAPRYSAKRKRGLRGCGALRAVLAPAAAFGGALIRRTGFAGSRAASRRRQWRMKAGEGPVSKGVQGEAAPCTTNANCEVRQNAASSIIFLIAPRPRCGGSRVSGGNLRVAAPSASLKLGALAVK